MGAWEYKAVGFILQIRHYHIGCMLRCIICIFIIPHWWYLQHLSLIFRDIPIFSLGSYIVDVFSL